MQFELWSVTCLSNIPHTQSSLPKLTTTELIQIPDIYMPSCQPYDAMATMIIIYLLWNIGRLGISGHWEVNFNGLVVWIWFTKILVHVDWWMYVAKEVSNFVHKKYVRVNNVIVQLILGLFLAVKIKYWYWIWVNLCFLWHVLLSKFCDH